MGARVAARLQANGIWPQIVGLSHPVSRLMPGMRLLCTSILDSRSGSGTHPTTAMCLTWLDGLSMHGKKVLDFGCGSGILGIAALLLGAESVVAVDIDAQAITATRQNAAQNKVLDRLTTSTDAATISGPFDVVVANILAGPLLDIAPQLCGLASSGADVALSGYS